MKVLCGAQARWSGKDLFTFASLGLKYFPKPWLAASANMPYVWNDGVYRPSSRPVEASGIGDPFFRITFDPGELLFPTMVVIKCPESGGPIIAIKDEDSLFGTPHLTLSAGASVPMGRYDVRDDTWIVSPQYQPGLGVWTTSLAAYLSQGIGPVTLGMGASYGHPWGANGVGFEPPDTLAASGSASWLFWYQRRGKLYVAANYLVPLELARQDGIERKGSDNRMLLADIGVSFWTATFADWRKVITGVMVTLPVIEGATDREAKNGTALNLFMAIGL